MKRIAVFLSCLAPLSIACASDDVTTKVEIGQGFRQDHLTWSIRGKHDKPNILSELDYKDMKVYLTTLKASISNETYIGSVELAYGNIYDGKARDSDYLRNNKKAEFSRSYAKVRDHYTFDGTVKVGRIFHLSDTITFTPSLGYGVFTQHLRVSKGYQDRWFGRHFKHHEQPLKGLKSTYNTRWTSPFAHMGFTIPVSSSVKMDLGYAFFYPMNYKGKGHWNLRHLHFTHKDRAWKSFGHKGDVMLRWACTDRIELGLGYALTKFYAKDGKTVGKVGQFRKATRTCSDYVLSLSYAW